MGKTDGPITAHHPAIQALLPLLGIDPSRATAFTLRVRANEVVTLEVETLVAATDTNALLAVIDRYELRGIKTAHGPALKLHEPETERPGTPNRISPEEIREFFEPYRRAPLTAAEELQSTPLYTSAYSDWLDGLHRTPATE